VAVNISAGPFVALNEEVVCLKPAQPKQVRTRSPDTTRRAAIVSTFSTLIHGKHPLREIDGEGCRVLSRADPVRQATWVTTLTDFVVTAFTDTSTIPLEAADHENARLAECSFHCLFIPQQLIC